MHDMKLKIRGERKKLVREEKKNGRKRKTGSLNIIINIHYILERNGLYKVLNYLQYINAQASKEHNEESKQKKKW